MIYLIIFVIIPLIFITIAWLLHINTLEVDDYSNVKKEEITIGEAISIVLVFFVPLLNIVLFICMYKYYYENFKIGSIKFEGIVGEVIKFLNKKV